MSYLYECGFPFSERLSTNLDEVVARVKNNKASLIIIDGGIGEGKTTLAVHLADYINKKNGLDEIKFKEQIALGGEEFTEKLRICYSKKLPVLIYDESGDFNKRGSLSRFNMNLNRTFEMFRAFKIVVILCLPLFAVLDQELLNKGIPQFLLHLKGRNQHQGEITGYSLYRMFYLKEKMSKLIVKPFAYQIVEPNIYGHFLNLPPNRARALDKYSTKGKVEFLVTSEISLGGLINSTQIAKKMNRSVDWVRKLLREAKISPKKIIKNVNYFSEEQVEMLFSYKESTAYKR